MLGDVNMQAAISQNLSIKIRRNMAEILFISHFSQWKPQNNYKSANEVLWQNQVSYD